MRKIILLLLMLLSFLVIVILPNSLNICIPDGCNFNNSVCGNDYCIGETLSQHIGERTQLLNVAVESQQFIIFLAVVLILFFVVQRYLETKKLVSLRLYIRQKLYSVKLFDYLLEAFSDGILHPQIYLSTN